MPWRTKKIFFPKLRFPLSVLPQDNLDKLMILTNLLSPTVYELINECSTFEIAVSVLKSAYVKCTNEVFSRHLLCIRKQQPCESLDEFLQVLKTLIKDCNFESVTANNIKMSIFVIRLFLAYSQIISDNAYWRITHWI